ncbi:transposase [Microbacterium profundi]|uniref:transposase n=1 Tax=Microbacterium profundi TaxID=450380 RepID=UPI001F3FAABC|nr:transposase [Microbacterium profundi]MCE7480419.1 transposase [Microbacterium profundi]
MAAAEQVTLEDIAIELYALPLTEFTAARNTRAKKMGDPRLATGVRALRKPLLAAWVVNLFARERVSQLREALDLAGDLREAQAELDAAALTSLNRQRRALIRALAQQARELAAAHGEQITQSTADAVEQTLNAAMFDADAAAAVASARLTRPLEVGGDSADLADSVAGDLGSAPIASAAAPVDEVRARRERKDAERALRAAESALTQAERERGEIDRNRKRVNDQIDRLAERADELESELRRIAKEADRSRRERDALDDGLTEAGTRVEEARTAAAAAQDALERHQDE